MSGGSDHHPSRLLRLSSINANVNLSRPPFYYVFTSNDRDLHQIRHVALKSVEIPNTQYNINIRNNTFRWDDGAPQSVTIPVGQYTVAALVAVLNPLIVAATVGFVITVVTLTRKLLFDSPINPITIQAITSDPLNTMASELGINADSPVAFVSHLADSVYNLTGLTHIYIASQALSNTTSMITGNDEKTNIFADLPISVPFGTVQTKDITVEESLDISDFASRKNISSIDIEIQSAPEVAALLNGAPWSLVFRVWQ